MRTYLHKFLTGFPRLLLAILLVTEAVTASPKKGSVLTPTLSINPTSLSGFSTKKNVPSATQSYTITAGNLQPGQEINITMPAGFEFSFNNNQTFVNSYKFTITDPTFTIAIAVRISAFASEGNLSGTITNHINSTAVSVDLPVSGKVLPGVIISANPEEIPEFHASNGQPSLPQSVAVTISNLDNSESVDVEAPIGVELATPGNPTIFSSTVAISTTGTSTLYVRLTATAPVGYLASLISFHPSKSQNPYEKYYIAVKGYVAASSAPTVIVSRSTISGDDLETTQGKPSEAASYKFVALNYPIATVFTITAPANFELSRSANGTFTDKLTFDTGVNDNVSLYISVRVKASAPVGTLTATLHHLASVNNGTPIDANANVDLVGTVKPGQNPPPANGNYGGNLEGVSCGVIGGWVFDKNQPNKAITVEILDGNTVVATTTAANFRQDLLNAGKGNGQHGFEISTPASLKDGQSHSIGVRVQGSNYSLPNSPKNLSCGNNPPPPPPPPVSGNFDGFLEGAYCSVIGGWVWDKNKPDAAYTVEILDGTTVVTSTLADHFRQDLVNAGKGNGKHGFQINTPASLKDGQTHSISVRVGGNTFVLKGSPKSLNCSPNGRIAAPSPESVPPVAGSSARVAFCASVNKPTVSGTLFCRGNVLTAAFTTPCVFPVGTTFEFDLNSPNKPVISLKTVDVPATTEMILPTNLELGNQYWITVVAKSGNQVIETSPASDKFAVQGLLTNQKPTVSGIPACAGNSITVYFEANCSAPANTVYEIILDRNTGGVKPPVPPILGSTKTPGKVTVTLPEYLSTDDKYAVFIRIDTPDVTNYSSSSAEFSVNGTLSFKSVTVSGVPACAGGNLTVNFETLCPPAPNTNFEIVLGKHVYGLPDAVATVLGSTQTTGATVVPLPANLAPGDNYYVFIRTNTGVGSGTLDSPPSAIFTVKSQGCVPPPPVSGNFSGNLEGVSCGLISGWVWDKNQPNKALTVEILDGNTVVATTTAANFRQDLVNAGKGNGQHGFQIFTPANLKNGQDHAISVRVQGSNYALLNSPGNLKCGVTQAPPPPPVSGNFDGYLEGAHCSVIGGWLWNKDKPDVAYTVEILDGTTVIASTLANHFRQDLVNAGKGNGQHGYEMNTPPSLKDGQTHSISVRVGGNGFVLKGSPKSLVCSPNGRVATPSAEEPGLLQVTAFPNPVVDVLTVQSQTPIDVPVRLRLTTLTGLIFFETNWTSDGELHRTEIPMRQTSAGLYLVETATPGRRQVIKIVKP